MKTKERGKQGHTRRKKGMLEMTTREKAKEGRMKGMEKRQSKQQVRESSEESKKKDRVRREVRRGGRHDMLEMVKREIKGKKAWEEEWIEAGKGMKRRRIIWKARERRNTRRGVPAMSS